jgi:hypothetical protein
MYFDRDNIGEISWRKARLSSDGCVICVPLEIPAHPVAAKSKAWSRGSDQPFLISWRRLASVGSSSEPISTAVIALILPTRFSCPDAIIHRLGEQSGTRSERTMLLIVNRSIVRDSVSFLATIRRPRANVDFHILCGDHRRIRAAARLCHLDHHLRVDSGAAGGRLQDFSGAHWSL